MNINIVFFLFVLYTIARDVKVTQLDYFFFSIAIVVDRRVIIIILYGYKKKCPPFFFLFPFCACSILPYRNGLHLKAEIEEEELL